MKTFRKWLKKKKKPIRFNPFSIVKFECLDQFWKRKCHFKAEKSSKTSFKKNSKLTSFAKAPPPTCDVLDHSYKYLYKTIFLTLSTVFVLTKHIFNNFEFSLSNLLLICIQHGKCIHVNTNKPFGSVVLEIASLRNVEFQFYAFMR